MKAKKTISYLLSLALILTSMSLGVFAETEDGQPAEGQDQTVTEIVTPEEVVPEEHTIL